MKSHQGAEHRSCQNLGGEAGIVSGALLVPVGKLGAALGNSYTSIWGR